MTYISGFGDVGSWMGTHRLLKDSPVALEELIPGLLGNSGHIEQKICTLFLLASCAGLVSAKIQFVTDVVPIAVVTCCIENNSIKFCFCWHSHHWDFQDVCIRRLCDRSHDP